MGFLTTASWIELELGLKSHAPPIIEEYEMSSIFEKYWLYNSLERAYRELSNVVNLGNFFAYIYQSNKSLATLRKIIIEKRIIDEKAKILETSLLNTELKIASIINKFSLNKGIKALGSAGIELGVSTLKDFDPKRIYLILKLYLEPIFDSLVDFILNNSKSESIKELASKLRKDDFDEQTSFNYFNRFIKKEELSMNYILDSLLGSEILIFSFSLAEPHFRTVFYEIIELERASEKEKIERRTIKFYEELDERIFKRYLDLGFNQDEIKEIIRKFKFSDRRLC